MNLELNLDSQRIDGRVTVFNSGAVHDEFCATVDQDNIEN